MIGSTTTGTTTANGGADGKTLIQTGRSEADRYFVGMLLKITSGACNGQKRVVSQWVKTTGVFTVTQAFTAQIVAGVSFGFVNVTLPQYPNRFKEKNPSEKKVRAMPNTLPLAVVMRGERTLEIEAVLYNGNTTAQLLSSFVAPLRELSHTVVVITSVDAFYDGVWLMDSFDPEPPAYPRVVKFGMKLSQQSMAMVF